MPTNETSIINRHERKKISHKGEIYENHVYTPFGLYALPFLLN